VLEGMRKDLESKLGRDGWRARAGVEQWTLGFRRAHDARRSPILMDAKRDGRCL